MIKKEKRIEKCYPLQKDALLSESGVQLCANIETHRGEVIDVKLFFKKDSVENAIDSLMRIRGIYSELKPPNKTVEEYFSTLDNFAKGLSERGIEESLIDILRTEGRFAYINEFEVSDILDPLVNTSYRGAVDLTLSALNKVTNENKKLFTSGSGVLTDIICDHFDVDDIDRLDDIGGIENLDDDVRECLVNDLAGISEEVALKLLPEIKEMFDEITKGKTIYFYDFDRQNRLWFESINWNDIEDLVELNNHYNNWGVEKEKIDDYIFEEIDESLSGNFSVFDDTKEFDEWYEKQFKDSDIQPNLDEARDLFMNDKIVAYDYDRNEFFDYDEYRDEQYKGVFNDIEEESKRIRTGGG